MRRMSRERVNPIPMFAVVCALLLVSIADAQTRDPAARPKTTSRISGRVVAADTGQPLRRAIVRLLSPEQHESRTALTDPHWIGGFVSSPGSPERSGSGKSASEPWPRR